MQIHWTCEGCDREDEARLEQHWERVQIELDGKLAALSEAARELRLAVYHDEAGPPWEIHAALHLPGRTLVAESRGRTPEETIDRTLSELADRMDRLEEPQTAVPLRQRQIEDMVPFLKECRDKERSQTFCSFLVPVLETLAPYVQQELQIRERDEQWADGITTGDILDEALLRAWDRFPQRNPSLPLDLWLVQLVDQAIEDAARHLACESLDEEQSLPSADADEDEWVEPGAYPDVIELADLLPGDGDIAAWDALEGDVKRAQLAEILGNLPREQRQAFVLNVAHGFNTAEIADFQSRPVSQVEEDLAAAILAFRRAVTEDAAPDLQDPFDRAKGRDRYPRRP